MTGAEERGGGILERRSLRHNPATLGINIILLFFWKTGGLGKQKSHDV